MTEEELTEAPVGPADDRSPGPCDLCGGVRFWAGEGGEDTPSLTIPREDCSEDWDICTDCEERLLAGMRAASSAVALFKSPLNDSVGVRDDQYVCGLCGEKRNHWTDAGGHKADWPSEMAVFGAATTDALVCRACCTVLAGDEGQWLESAQSIEAHAARTAMRAPERVTRPSSGNQGRRTPARRRAAAAKKDRRRQRKKGRR